MYLIFESTKLNNMKYHYLLNKRISFVKQAFIVGLSLFFFLPIKAYHIRGKVVDPTQKQTLIGANVVVKRFYNHFKNYSDR